MGSLVRGKRNRMASAIVHFLCCIWVVSLVATVDHEHQGVHTGLDARRAVLGDLDVDCDGMNLVGHGPFNGMDGDIPVAASPVGNRSPGSATAGTPSRQVSANSPHPASSGTISPTVLRL